jgi:glucose/arabinose dehydrogenase
MRIALTTLGLAFLLAVPAQAAELRLERVGDFDEPVYVAGPPGSRHMLAVVERYGLVRLVRRGRVLRRPLVDLRRRVLVEDPRETVDQRGLLSMAFAPDYRRSRRFYVMYVNRRGRLRVDAVRRGRVRRVLDLGEAASQHHGGQLQFGPDGLLYVSTGIGDDPTASGKILRLDPSRPRPEVYATGLRNPWRFSFHRRTMLIGDVGDRRVEEINIATSPGTDFGWPAYEGHEDDARYTPPALAHRHPRWCAIVGGYVRRGRYLYGDLCGGRIWSARFAGDRLGRPRRTRLRVPYLVSFGRDGARRLYAVSFFGAVYRLAQSRSR